MYNEVLPTLILAGGLARRISPLSDTTPKSLININEKPFIFYQLEDLSRQGIKKVILCVGHLSNQIKDAVGDGKKFGLKICYSEDGREQLGTGGSINKALPLAGNHFMVLYGDSFVSLNYKKIIKEYFHHNKPTLMTIYRNKDLYDKSNVSILNNNLIEYNKKNPKKTMSLVDYGLSVISRESFKRYAKDQFDLSDYYEYQSENSNLVGYEVFERFYEIGSLEGIRETKKYFKERDG